MGLEPAVIDMADPAYWQDPHRFMREARERYPVALAATGEPIVLRYADIERLASDHRVGSNALAFVERSVDSGPLVAWWRRMLTNVNGTEHRRLRGLVSRAFTPRSVDAKRPRMRELTREILARHRDTGELDVLHDFSHELPIRLICELLGVPPEYHDAFSHWSTSLGSALSSVLTPELREAGEEAVTGMSGAIADLLGRRRASPQDDLLSALLAAAEELEEEFTEEDLVVLVINLVFGGHDTSRAMLAVGVALLCSHPEELARLLRDPTLASRAGDEVLRCEPLVQVMSRECPEALEVAGVPLPAGEPFMLAIIAANRDPEVFESPDRFDVTRSGPHSFSLGWGAHRCLGAALARAEFEEVVPEFFDRCRNVELLVDRPEWVPFANLRRIERLPVRFEPA